MEECNSCVIEMDKLKAIFGGFAIASIIAVYGIYMAFGPGGDGIVFGSVIGAILGIAGGIAGFEYGLKRVEENKT